MRTLFGFFEKSPSGPLAQHTESVHEAVTLMPPASATHTLAGAVMRAGLA